MGILHLLICTLTHLNDTMSPWWKFCFTIFSVYKECTYDFIIQAPRLREFDQNLGTKCIQWPQVCTPSPC